jgi:hypothetical protein
MLYFPQTRIELSVERPVAQGSQITAEGAALVGVLVAGLFGVRQSAGVAGERLHGVSINSVTALTQVPKLEEAVLGNTNAIVVGAEPIGGSVRVVVGTTVLTAGATASPTQYAISPTNPRQFLFDASFQGQAVSIAYAYAPTLAQAMALQGNVLPGGPAGQYLGQVGVITRGDVYTDQWDTAADWSTAVGVTLAAGGKFAPTANVANALEGVQIIELPSAARSFLGLSINAAA